MRIAHVNLGGHVTAVDGIRAAETAIETVLSQAGHTVDRFDVSGADIRAAVAASRHLVRRAAARSIDVVHFHSLFRPLHAGLAATLRAYRVPYVVSPHSALAPAALARDRFRKALYLQRIERHVLRGAASVVCLTRAEANDVERLSDLHTTVIPNPFDVVGILPWAPPADRRPRFVSLSRFDVYQKGLDRLAEIAAYMPEAEVQVHGAPDGNEPELVGLLRRTSPENFSLCEPVFDEAKARMLSTADVYVQASRWEGLSVSLVEAFAAGMPTAVSKSIALTLPSALVENSLVLDPDPQQAAADLIDLAGDDQRRLRMGAHTAAWVRSELTPERVIQRFEALYHAAGAFGDQVGR